MISWHSVLPDAVLAAAMACAFFAGRAAVFRRRRAVAPDPGPVITDGIEAHVAVGSLSGIAPSDINAHVLLVVTNDGQLGISGTGCGSFKAFILAKASAAVAGQEFAEHDHVHVHDHGHGGER
jgi:hypothetical protein